MGGGAKGNLNRKVTMTKLTLDLDALDVQSFEAVGSRKQGRGTVVGADGLMTLPEYCITFTCGDSHIRACLD
jgi:hypothetical protein